MALPAKEPGRWGGGLAPSSLTVPESDLKCSVAALRFEVTSGNPSVACRLRSSASLSSGNFGLLLLLY